MAGLPPLTRLIRSVFPGFPTCGSFLSSQDPTSRWGSIGSAGAGMICKWPRVNKSNESLDTWIRECGDEGALAGCGLLSPLLLETTSVSVQSIFQAPLPLPSSPRGPPSPLCAKAKALGLSLACRQQGHDLCGCLAPASRAWGD